MAIVYPTTLDTLTNPAATDPVTSPSHSLQHSNANDAIEALEAKVGVDSSAVTTSHDYKLSGITSTDKAVSKTGTETLTNKTLTAPKFADLGFIADANGNELIIFDTVASAGNEITIANAATGNNPKLSATGGDNDVGFDYQAKGLGKHRFLGTSGLAAEIQLYEDTDDGTNYSAFRGSARSGNIIYTMPTTDPVAGQNLAAGTPSGNVSALSWASPNTAATCRTLIPMPASPIDISGSSLTNSVALAVNTTANVGQIIIPFGITVNKISIRTGATVTVAGTFDITLYSEDGQTQIFSVTTESLASVSTIYTTAVASIALTAGVYYLMVNPNSTANLTTYVYTTENDVPFGVTAGLAMDITSEPVMEGTLTITDSTPPATIDPTAITGAVTKTLVIRLDN